VADDPVPFVSLKSLKQGPIDPAAALAEIRQIYFKTTKRTIDNDFAHAVDLLKGLPDEETREKATVYMEGLAQMRKEWGPQVRGQKSKVKGQESKAKGQRHKGNRRKRTL
jgi:hypothetical protein